jgi:hypothetical protein
MAPWLKGIRSRAVQLVSRNFRSFRALRNVTHSSLVLASVKADGQNFGLPEMIGNQLRSLVPWSRILSDTEVLLAINTDPNKAKTAWVTIDASLHKQGDLLTSIYSTVHAQIGEQLQVESRNGLSIELTVPTAGFTIFE